MHMCKHNISVLAVGVDVFIRSVWPSPSKPAVRNRKVTQKVQNSKIMPNRRDDAYATRFAVAVVLLRLFPGQPKCELVCCSCGIFGHFFIPSRANTCPLAPCIESPSLIPRASASTSRPPTARNWRCFRGAITWRESPRTMRLWLRAHLAPTSS